MPSIRDRAIRLWPWIWKAIRHPLRPSKELADVHDSLALSLRRHRAQFTAIKRAAAQPVPEAK